MQLSYRAIPCSVSRWSQALPQPWEETSGFCHSSMVAKAMQVEPLVVLTRQVRFPWRYHWNFPVPPKARPFGGLGETVSLTGRAEGVDGVTVVGGKAEAMGAFMDSGG